VNIGGSFLATTADWIDLADRTQSSPLLRVSIPIGLQFGPSAGIIGNQSVAPLVDSTGNPVLDDDDNPIAVGLRVLPRRTLALVGGPITLEGGFLTAESGRIELGSVEGSGSVSLTPTDQGWVLGYNSIQNFQDISLSQEALVDTSGDTRGDIQMQGRRVTLTEGSQVVSVALTEGQAGDLRVSASELLELEGTSADGGFPTGLFNEVEQEATGEGGTLTIETGQLIIKDGAQVSTTTWGTGRGVDLIVKASESVELDGVGPRLPGGLFARTQQGANITSRSLDVQDGAEVTVSGEGSGPAGNLNITASSIRLDGGRLTAETQGGSGANINLQDVNLLLMGNQSLISAQAFNDANGGDITTNAENGFIVAVPEEDTDIIANASEGRGGNIQITTQGIFGIEQRLAIPGNGTNDIDASSQFGVNGVVTINRPDVDPSQGLLNLSDEPVNVEVAQGCQAAGTQASVAFFNTGRGGLAPNPYEPISSNNIWEDIPLATQRTENSASTARAFVPPVTPPNKIVEAQGWIVNGKGEVVLVAEMPTTQSRSRCSLR
jgi:large exoprotein involved in heme utilization and adhesion